MQGHIPNKVYNNLVQGTGVLHFSKLPMILDNSLSSQSLVTNITSYSIPPIEAEMKYDHYIAQSTTVIPTSSFNDFSGNSLTINLIADEDLENYRLLLNWINLYKRTTNRTANNTMDGKFWDTKQAFCPYVDIMMYNNNNKIINVIRFRKVYINILGQLSQEFNSDAPVTFDASFKYVDFAVVNDPDNITSILGDSI